MYLVIYNEQTDSWFHKLGPFEMFQCFQCFFSISLMGLLTSSLMGILKEKNAITWSKGDINEFSKGENNNKICNFDEYDIFTVQHWDLVWFIPVWNAKSIYLFCKLLALNSIKINLNLVTKLKLFSAENITNIDFNFIAKILKFKKLNSFYVTWSYIIKGSPIKSCLWPLWFFLDRFPG